MVSSRTGAGKSMNEGKSRSLTLESHVGYMLRRAQLSVFQDFSETTQSFGLTPAEYSVLVVLHESPGTRPNNMAKLLAIKPANCIVLINKLEQDELVRRDDLPGNSRAIGLFLTPSGIKLLRRIEKKVATHRQRVLARLGSEGQKQLLDLLRKLIDGWIPDDN